MGLTEGIGISNTMRSVPTSDQVYAKKYLVVLQQYCRSVAPQYASTCPGQKSITARKKPTIQTINKAIKAREMMLKILLVGPTLKIRR